MPIIQTERFAKVICDIILNSAVAGLKMAHLTKITSSFEFSVLTLTVPGLRLKKSSKYLVLLAICTIFKLLNCRI